MSILRGTNANKTGHIKDMSKLSVSGSSSSNKYGVVTRSTVSGWEPKYYGINDPKRFCVRGGGSTIPSEYEVKEVIL
ncbi:hypothetical protein ACS6ZR_02880 [Streptococcus suis]|uniref:hypothetical protein n=1 Tax=Streptococcus suis TaxID=1307 RepID=UPI000CF43442|nr:hypothetical protein [Streptococcus suis]MCL4880810.1 hypothetical protein [Streptococcus suis]HEM4926261.1 hypothetical protein [Streptococcus suis]